MVIIPCGPGIDRLAKEEGFQDPFFLFSGDSISVYSVTGNQINWMSGWKGRNISVKNKGPNQQPGVFSHAS
jgi:hypothetical protein